MVTANDLHADARVRSKYSDENQYMLDRLAVEVYLEMGLITQEQYNASDPAATIDVLQSIPELDEEQQKKFSVLFTDKIVNNDNLLAMVPPLTLAYAYTELKKQRDNDPSNNELATKLNKVSERIDTLSNDFNTNIGFYYADPSNIADVYDGYKKMFEVRMPDVSSSQQQAIRNNLSKLEELVSTYDSKWGISDINSVKPEKLEQNWDELSSMINNIPVSDATLSEAAKYKFLDKEDKVIPQFIDAQGNAKEEFKDGYRIDKQGRLQRVIDLARQDIIMRECATYEGSRDTKRYQEELDEQLMLKLFEIDTVNKVMQGAQENPEQFTRPEFLEQFKKNLANDGGSITDNGYQAAIDNQVNQVAGFVGRVKTKFGKAKQKLSNFANKVFTPIRDIDKRAKDRGDAGDRESLRKKRIDFFIRILKGFGSAFLFSAAITVVATAAAATAGVSVAVAIATIGVVTGIAMGALQIHKWRKNQQAAGKPTTLAELLKDKRMLATLGTTALASIAMIFGAAGLAQAATALGFGALALGGTSNAIQMYKDAKASGFSKAESLTWAIANAAAIAVGGIAGRTVANAGINAYNQNNPENTLFQTKDTVQDTRTTTDTRTETVYTPEALDNAKRIAEMWYQDNPDLLQQRVDMINQYNAANGTTIDPYRAIVLNADAGAHVPNNMALHVDGGGIEYTGGQHTVLTRQWAMDNGFSMDDVSNLKNLFMADGSINPDGIQAAMKIDPHVSAINEVGTVTAGDTPHYDGVLHQNTVDANGTPVHNVYADGDSPFTTKTTTVLTQETINVDTYTPVNVPWTMGMFGVYNKAKEKAKRFKERAGSLLDRIKKGKKRDEPKPGPVPPTPVPPKPTPVPPKPLPPHIDDGKLLPPHIDDKLLPPHIDDGKLLPPHQDDKILPPHQEPKLLPEHQKKRILRITRAQANNLNLLPEQIAELEEKRQQNNGKKQADVMWAKQKKLQQELDTLLNKLGRPTDEELEAAKQDAFRRYDLENANKELAKVRERLDYMASHPGNVNKHDLKLLKSKEEELVALIEGLMIDETDVEYYDPTPLHPDHSKKNDFAQGIGKIRTKKPKPRVIITQNDVER